MTRMDKASFFALVHQIDQHPVFYSNSQNEQALVEWQLALTLDRLGHEGNGSCLNRLIPTWGVRNGSLCNFTNRCFQALEDALKGYLKWPEMAERRVIAQEFSKKGFPGCVGLIDGTLIPLSQRPAESGECYFDRKCRYSINAQVVCDHKQKILYLFTGLPGSVSDLTYYKRSSLCRNQNDGHLFSRGQYLLGDSGYEPMDHMVSAYKRADTSQEWEDFNMCVAKRRVTNEHCIGVLKSRWHSLREMHTQLRSKKEIAWLIRWIIMCARLQNYVIGRNDLWTEEDSEIHLDHDSDSDAEREEHLNLPTNPRRHHQASRLMLQNHVIEYAMRFHKQPGGCLNVRTS